MFAQTCNVADNPCATIPLIALSPKTVTLPSDAIQRNSRAEQIKDLQSVLDEHCALHGIEINGVEWFQAPVHIVKLYPLGVTTRENLSAGLKELL